MCGQISLILTVVFVLWSHVGEDDPSQPVCNDEQDCDERQNSIKPSFQPGLTMVMMMITTTMNKTAVRGNSMKPPIQPELSGDLI